ncbi:hypothetical protein MLD38_039743 [Melastoma candidum]|uniref:Uncharacterized protein n=1 Tax=Melastoma candidum TaxID=119954 RepID=A0ACB9L3T4_9MYRT|nr:hypothetical protein MLD38_039743 [Melastoma candidum]
MDCKLLLLYLYLNVIIISKEGLLFLVEYNEKKMFEVKLKEMKSALTAQITEETDMSEQQNANAALRQVKTWAKLLNTFCTNGKIGLELMYKVQIQCYDDAKLMKLFPEIVRSLYEQDVLAEDTILYWFRKGTNPKSRQIFVKSIKPFVNWLEEAEEEE